MEVHYSKPIGITMLILGIINLILSLILWSIGGSPLASLIPGIACTFISIGYLTKSYFTVNENWIVTYALLGPLKRETRYESFDELIVSRNELPSVEGAIPQ